MKPSVKLRVSGLELGVVVPPCGTATATAALLLIGIVDYCVPNRPTTAPEEEGGDDDYRVPNRPTTAPEEEGGDEDYCVPNRPTTTPAPDAPEEK